MQKNLHYIIADDDELYREITLQQLASIPGIECLAVCSSAIEVLQLLTEKQPDLLILDIEMPGLSGIQLAKSLTNLPLTIFISSHSHYATDAFEVDALDYLVKPVAQERLERAIGKARNLLELKNTINTQEGFTNNEDHSFYIKDKNSFIRILYDEVLYIQSLGDFVNIYLDNGEKKIALVSLKNMEQQLPASYFIRISRTHMVNKNKIKALESNFVSLQNLQLPIGKTYTEQVLQAILGNKAVKRFL